MSDEPHVRLSFEDPFLAPVEDRRLDRRLRGRLLSPVTVWTAGSAARRAGLTVSSMLVAEGEPAEIVGLLDPLCDLRHQLEADGAFVVHILHEGDRRLASSFAGKYPVDPYEGLEVTDTSYGPVIGSARTIVSCRFTAAHSVGYQDLVTGVIDSIELGAPAPPLGYYRGRFRGLRED